MLAAAQPFVGTVFKQPADIFDISPDELVGLFHEPDPAFIALTLARWPLLLEAENRLKRCWSVTQEDFAALTPDVAGLWTELLRCDLINQYGALQDKCRTLRSSSELDLAPAFEPIKQQVFAALMRPMADLSVGLQAFERSVAEAVALLEQQVQAATLPALRASYRAEQARLQERVQRLKARAASEGWL
jgi:hypothetical protein